MTTACILFLLLAPMPRQTPDNSARRTTQINKAPAHNENVSTPAPIQNQPSPPKGQSKTDNPAGESEPRHIVIDSSPRKDAWDKVYICLTGALVVIGGLTLGAIWYQAIQSRKAADAAKSTVEAVFTQTEVLKDTAQRQLRAYVLVWAATIKFRTLDAPEVHVHFKNVGQTPAYHLRGWISIWIEEHPLKIVLPKPRADFGKGTETLAPGRSTMFIASKHPPVPTESIPLLGTPHGTIYVYGEISYTDAFGNGRTTKYRLMHGGAEGVHTYTKEGVLTALLKPDTEGNESD